MSTAFSTNCRRKYINLHLWHYPGTALAYLVYYIQLRLMNVKVLHYRSQVTSQCLLCFNRISQHYLLKFGNRNYASSQTQAIELIFSFEEYAKHSGTAKQRLFVNRRMVQCNRKLKHYRPLLRRTTPVRKRFISQKFISNT